MGAEKVMWKYRELEGSERGVAFADVYVDSDWAGNTDRKSTSGGLISLEGSGVKHWSRTQKTRALSSGEAEYAALVSGCAEGLGFVLLGVDLGYEIKLRVHMDAEAGKGVAARRGLGKMKHVELKYLWVQDVVKEGRLKLLKIHTDVNPADHLTKPKSKSEMHSKISLVDGYIV